MINNTSIYKTRYKLAKSKYIGETTICPYCEKSFCKTTAVKYFCSKKCKTNYKLLINPPKEKLGYDNSLFFLQNNHHIVKYDF